MKDSQRNNRIRRLVKQLNQRRKQQAAQMDILCNDIVSAHRGFMDTISSLSFAADFSESLIGIRDIEQLFYIAARSLRSKIGGVEIAFFLCGAENFEVFGFAGDGTDPENPESLENFFTSEIVKSVTKLSRVCDLDEMLRMGLQVNPTLVKTTSAVAVPLSNIGPAAGFALVYDKTGKKITAQQIHMLSIIRRSICRAITVCNLKQKATS